MQIWNDFLLKNQFTSDEFDPRYVCCAQEIGNVPFSCTYFDLPYGHPLKSLRKTYCKQ
jgi:hypothetical protein